MRGDATGKLRDPSALENREGERGEEHLEKLRMTWQARKIVSECDRREGEAAQGEEADVEDRAPRNSRENELLCLSNRTTTLLITPPCWVIYPNSSAITSTNPLCDSSTHAAQYRCLPMESLVTNLFANTSDGSKLGFFDAE